MDDATNCPDLAGTILHVKTIEPEELPPGLVLYTPAIIILYGRYSQFPYRGVPEYLLIHLSGMTSKALEEYINAFQGHETESFVTYYPVGGSQQNGSNRPYTLTRGQFWKMSTYVASIFKKKLGLQKGGTIIHLFKGNSVEDLALRFASVMTGVVPVTVNWDSDPVDRILYKITASQARVVFTHQHTPSEQIEAVRTNLPEVTLVSVESFATKYEQGPFLDASDFDATVGEEDTRIIIYTSGSSGEPKGVRLPYRSYVTNRLTFESFLKLEDPSSHFTPVLVNPMHHTNSTAFTDWALRRPGAHLHLYERYTTPYWAILAQIALEANEEAGENISQWSKEKVDKTIAGQVTLGLRIIAPTVSRHFDFLEGLVQEGRLPIDPSVLKAIAPVVTFLIGSAPVGPRTVSRLMHHLGRLPAIRFGSTETCLQVMGTPLDLSKDVMLETFKRGWEAPDQEGFYVGRPHPPYTEVMVVRGIDKTDSTNYLVECAEGGKGYLVTRGKNLMSGYVQGEQATRKAIDTEAGGWYTNLGDIFFYLKNPHDGSKDYYWVSRTSNLLIRGGANYSYDQITNDLTKFVASHYNLPTFSFAVAAVGLRLSSEHEDDCLVTVELLEPEAQAKASDIEATFLSDAKKHATKGAKPNRVRLGTIPRNFKGDINWRSLEAEWKQLATNGSK